jgi:hypothetical protein
MGTTSNVVVGPPVHFLNVEYFFRIIYDAIFSIQSVSSATSLSNLSDLASTIWLFVTLFAYLIVLVLIGFLVYFTTRMYQVQEEDALRYTTIAPEVAHAEVEHSRWAYIRELIESPQQSDWRQAIIEADIMLDEMLSKLGYEGASVGDKLKTANQSHFHTLDDAWTAHRVRNDIAHQGSTYQLSDHIAYRTINQYENVFREFNEI